MVIIIQERGLVGFMDWFDYFFPITPIIFWCLCFRVGACRQALDRHYTCPKCKNFQSLDRFIIEFYFSHSFDVTS